MTRSEISQQNWQPLGSDISAETLRWHLVRADIPVSEWGQGSAKTLEHLLQEIKNGESQISISPDATRIKREVSVAWLDVLHLSANGTVLALREARQEYSDGRVRKRSLDWSLGEKMMPNENPATAAARALQEELGVAEPETLHFLGSEKTKHTADSYPGLESHYNMHTFVATLDEAAFNPSGYIERQADKTNYYEWEPAN